MWRTIGKEFSRHLPFTLLGALTGIVLMCIIVLGGLPQAVSERIFYVFHPLHVLLSALVTCSIYRRYRRHRIWAIAIGYTGSVGIGTISDIIFPYLGGLMVGAEMHFHLGFIEKWWLVNPMALAGIGVALWKPTTRIPHLGHVLLSTWASLFYLIAHGEADWISVLPVVFVILTVAVWLPCCVSDIVFPLLFVGKEERAAREEIRHSHG